MDSNRWLELKEWMVLLLLLGQCVRDWSLAKPLKFIPKVFHLIFLAGKQDYMKTSIHKATQMFIMVAKDTEEGHYSFPYDNIEGLLQPGFQKDPTQGRFYLNISRKWIPGLLLLKDPRYSYRSCLPSSHEHSEWVGILGSAEKLCTPCLEGHLSQGKTCIKELCGFFFPPCHLLVWVARGLSLFSVIVRMSLWGQICITLLWACPWDRYCSRWKTDNICLLL